MWSENVYKLVASTARHVRDSRREKEEEEDDLEMR